MKQILTLFLGMLIAYNGFAQRDIHYIAIELDAPSQQRVAQYAEANLPWSDARIIAHHMTILHYTGLRCSPDDPELAAKDYILNWALAHEGETFSLTASQVGHSNRAFALRITETPVPSRNRIKHITLATNNATGGSAVDSNYITSWSDLPEPLTLSGKLTIFYK